MNTVGKLQLVCFFVSLIAGFAYGQGEYALAAVSGMTVAISLVLIYSIIKPD